VLNLVVRIAKNTHLADTLYFEFPAAAAAAAVAVAVVVVISINELVFVMKTECCLCDRNSIFTYYLHEL
jgi:hypothetical protein